MEEKKGADMLNVLDICDIKKALEGIKEEIKWLREGRILIDTVWLYVTSPLTEVRGISRGGWDLASIKLTSPLRAGSYSPWRLTYSQTPHYAIYTTPPTAGGLRPKHYLCVSHINISAPLPTFEKAGMRVP